MLRFAMTNEAASASLYSETIFGDHPSEDLQQAFDMPPEAEFRRFPLCALPKLAMKQGVSKALCNCSG
jgi:hypothetical protein